MAKYVCDFSEVNRIASELCDLASSLNSNLSNYNSRISSDLSSWNGSAKGTFTSQCDGQVTIAKANADILNELGAFIKSSAASIQQVEDELSNLSI